jgi:hypothetical protein
MAAYVVGDDANLSWAKVEEAMREEFGGKEKVLPAGAAMTVLGWLFVRSTAATSTRAWSPAGWP